MSKRIVTFDREEMCKFRLTVRIPKAEGNKYQVCSERCYKTYELRSQMFDK